jgi:hypothetical protein
MTEHQAFPADREPEHPGGADCNGVVHGVDVLPPGGCASLRSRDPAEADDGAGDGLALGTLPSCRG